MLFPEWLQGHQHVLTTLDQCCCSRTATGKLLSALCSPVSWAPSDPTSVGTNCLFKLLTLWHKMPASMLYLFLEEHRMWDWRPACSKAKQTKPCRRTLPFSSLSHYVAFCCMFCTFWPISSRLKQTLDWTLPFKWYVFWTLFLIFQVLYFSWIYCKSLYINLFCT